MADFAGQWSKPSKPVSATTLKAVAQQVGVGSMTTKPGDCSSLISENPQITLPRHSTLGSGPAMFCGADGSVDYRSLGMNDSVVEVQALTLPQGAVSISIKKLLQMIPILPWGSFDRAQR